ncbi:hypothetical protein [Streptomyces sp. NPDC127098]
MNHATAEAPPPARALVAYDPAALAAGTVAVPFTTGQVQTLQIDGVTD